MIRPWFDRVRGTRLVIVELGAGSLLVPLSGPTALRAALLLEPTQLYGLYQFDQFRELVDDDGRMPVFRVLRSEDPWNHDLNRD